MSTKIISTFLKYIFHTTFEYGLLLLNDSPVTPGRIKCESETCFPTNEFEKESISEKNIGIKKKMNVPKALSLNFVPPDIYDYMKTLGDPKSFEEYRETFYLTEDHNKKREDIFWLKFVETSNSSIFVLKYGFKKAEDLILMYHKEESSNFDVIKKRIKKVYDEDVDLEEMNMIKLEVQSLNFSGNISFQKVTFPEGFGSYYLFTKRKKEPIGDISKLLGGLDVSRCNSKIIEYVQRSTSNKNVDQNELLSRVFEERISNLDDDFKMKYFTPVYVNSQSFVDSFCKIIEAELDEQ